MIKRLGGLTMNNIFNTTLEMAMRYLIILECTNGKSFSEIQLVNIDFICSYGNTFNIGNFDLHGNNNLKYSELCVRRENSKKSIQYLLIKKLITIKVLKSGFEYCITESGKITCNNLCDEYADEYEQTVRVALNKYKNITEIKISELINRMAVKEVRRLEHE